jgi:hypothetical protein
VDEDTPQHRVVLCQPVYGHVPPAAHLAQCQFILHAGTNGLYGIVHARDTYIDWGRNWCVKMAYDSLGDFTHLLWLDADVIPPLDAMERLLAHDKDIVGGLYHKKGPPFEPVAYDFDTDEGGKSHATYERTAKLDLESGDLFEVGGLGLGLTLVKREVVEAIATKMVPGIWFQTTLSYGEDVWFCHWAKQLGFSAWLDSSLRCAHVGDREFTTDDWVEHRDQARMTP